MNYYLLQALILQLQNKISGLTISRIISPNKNFYYIILTDKSGRENCLQFYTDNNNSYIFFRENFSIPSKNIADLVTGSYNEKVISFGIKNEDKLIEFILSSGKSLIISLIRNKENVFLLLNDIVSESVKNSKELEGKNINDIIPPVKTPPSLEAASLKEYFRIKAPKFGNEVFNSILQKLALKQDDKHEGQVIKLFNEELKKYEMKISSPDFGLFQKDEKLIPALFSLNENIYHKINSYSDANELISGYANELYRQNIFRDVKEKKEKELSKKIFAIEKSIKFLEIQLEDSRNSIKHKLAGDAILSAVSTIPHGSTEFEFYNEKGEQEKIKLKTELSPSENAQFYYAKYKKHKASSGVLSSKIEKLEKENAKLLKELEDLKNTTEIKKLKKMEKEDNKNEQDETSRFRKFVISAGAEVWVGKDSASNDLLTTRYSAQNDLWFHVRGFSGSHTVLKMTDKNSTPPSEIVKIAASIAAYYSKARNAGTVPVAYTERKYVKKKKGFKEGSVVMEREKVVYVKPKLPE